MPAVAVRDEAPVTVMAALISKESVVLSVAPLVSVAVMVIVELPADAEVETVRRPVDASMLTPLGSPESAYVLAPVPPVAL